MIQNVPLNVREHITQKLGLTKQSQLLDFSFSGGGCINPGGRLTTTAGKYFLKWNSAGKFPLMFDREAKGLNLLRKVRAIAIPEVVIVDEAGEHQFILLEFIDQGPQVESFWTQLGSQLATMHKTSNDKYGLDHDNYIGSLRQSNSASGSWIDFFILQRLNVQLKMAVDSGLADSQMIKSFESLYPKLSTLLGEVHPSLLHGDLWSGNIIPTPSGTPCLIDPAVYFGCREVDLAMTKLFGSFPSEFYDAYHYTFPLAPAYEDRFDLYNLYPLLVHLNLFGAQYRSPIVRTLDRFV